MQQKHWVEEMFPPTYSYSVTELLKASSTLQGGGDHDAQRTTSDGRTTSDRKTTSNERTTSDGRSISELYERVRKDFNLEIQERRQKCIQVGSPVGSETEASEVLNGSPVRKKGQRLNSNDNESIWSPGELQILRKAFQQAKSDVTNITIQLQLAKEEERRAKEKCTEQETKLETLAKMLHQSRQHCKRADIRGAHLESELRRSNGKVKILEDDVAELTDVKRILKRTLREEQKKLNQEHRVRTDIELRLQEDTHKLRLDHIAREEEVKLDYQMQINGLYAELEETRDALEQEQKAHRIDKKALEHLRIHFASLPSANADGSSGDVR